jgi:hypothetical protein
MWKRGIGETFAVMLALATPGAAQKHETINITVRVRNDAGISESIIGLARAAAVKVFSAVGRIAGPLEHSAQKPLGDVFQKALPDASLDISPLRLASWRPSRNFERQ